MQAVRNTSFVLIVNNRSRFYRLECHQLPTSEFHVKAARIIHHPYMHPRFMDAHARVRAYSVIVKSAE